MATPVKTSRITIRQSLEARSFAGRLAQGRIHELAAQGEGATAMPMDIQSIIISLIIGAVAGWLAGQIVRGVGFGLIGNIIVGMVGAVVAGWLFPSFWPITGIIGAIIHSAIGAVIVLFVVGLIKRA
jgi:uncharacterized membrane protein YeaQ/YmgE (transglycosylase-associated protein family)